MNGILEKLFGSNTRIKIMRFFLRNPELVSDIKDISRKTKSPIALVQREIFLLKDIGMLKRKNERVDEIIKLKNGKFKNKKKEIQGFKLNLLFPFNMSLKNLLIDAVPIDREKMIKDISSIGKVRLIILSGIFSQPSENDNDTDMLIVSDSVRKTALERILKNIEAELGRELVYALFTSEEFKYRFEMHDRFVCDILSYPHIKLINKLNI